VRCRPPYSLAFANLAAAYERWGDPAAAARVYAEWLTFQPTDAATHNRLAWLLATTPDARARDARKAIAHATRACELGEYKDGNHIDTLAAALAAAGEFEKAVAEQKRALAMPAFERKYGPAARFRLALYEQGQAYRQPSRPPLAPPPRAR
jgi:tetratricopeptide (TPR) repeat protein